jgi:hypothetical protein
MCQVFVGMKKAYDSRHRHCTFYVFYLSHEYRRLTFITICIREASYSVSKYRNTYLVIFQFTVGYNSEIL